MRKNKYHNKIGMNNREKSISGIVFSFLINRKNKK